MHATAEDFDNVHNELLSKLDAGQSQTCCFGNITLTLHSKSARNNVESIALSRYEYLILWLLVRAQGNLITRDEMMYFLYDDDESDLPLHNCLEVFLSRLRRKIEILSHSVRIETFRAVGYRLVLQ